MKTFIAFLERELSEAKLRVKSLEAQIAQLKGFGDCSHEEARAEVVSQIEEAADDCVSHALKTWPNDSSMINCAKNDAADLKTVAALLGKGERQKARAKAQSLDTAVRDCIPDAAWDYLHGLIFPD